MALAPKDVLTEARQQWTAAFNRCYMYTLRSLAFPASYGMRTGHEHLGHYPPSSIMSVLSSGQPLPKSPSVQLQDLDPDPVEQEREERGWWAARFQHVLREISSRDELESMMPPSESLVSRDEFLQDPFTNIDPPEPPPARPLSIIAKSKLFKLKR